MKLLKLLNIAEFYGVSETVDIAKGKYKIPLSLKEGLQQRKRYDKKDD